MRQIGLLATCAAAALAMVPATAVAAPDDKATAARLQERLEKLEAEARAANDRWAVSNLFSRYMYLHNAFQDAQIIPLWAKEGTPGISAEYSNLGRYTT